MGGDIKDLLDAFQAVFEPFVKKKNRVYQCNMDVQHEYMICDVTKLREIVLNIISNSVKYTGRDL